MERGLIFLFVVLFLAAPSGVRAQGSADDFGMWYDLGAEKKLSKRWSADVEGTLRTRNNTRTIDRWSISIGTGYRLLKGKIAGQSATLKASGGYTLLFDNNKEELTMKETKNGWEPNKWTPSYWGIRHRFNVGLTGAVDWGRLGISLRERWQYTYRPEAEGKRYDIDNDEWDPVKGKGKNVLRSRLQLAYDVPHWKLDPFAGIETFHGKGGLQKTRYQVGIDYKLKKQHAFSLTYRYQNVGADDDDLEVNSHLIGISYTYKFK